MQRAKPRFTEFQMAVATVTAMFLGQATGQALAKNPVIIDIMTMQQQTECILRHMRQLSPDLSNDEFHQEMHFITKACRPG